MNSVSNINISTNCWGHEVLGSHRRQNVDEDEDSTSLRDLGIYQQVYLG
jgi:hypothetical protein